MALLVALIVVLLQTKRLPVPAFISLIAAIPLIIYVLAATSVASGFFSRGGTESVSTLNSRTIAWHAAFSGDGGFWKQWFGGGLAVRLFPFQGPTGRPRWSTAAGCQGSCKAECWASCSSRCGRSVRLSRRPGVRRHGDRCGSR